MSTASGGQAQKSAVSPRAIIGIVIVVALVVWILGNRAVVEVSFLVATVSMSLWLALAIAAVLGLAAGFLIGRKRYRPR